MGLVSYRPKRKRQPPESVEPSKRWIARGLVLAINGRSGGRVVAWTSNGLTVNTMLGAVALGAREPGFGGLYTGTQGTSIMKGSTSASAVNGSEFITLVTTAAPSTLANEIRALGFANDGGTALFNLEVSAAGVWRLQIRNNASVAINLTGGSAAVGRADTIIGRVSGYGGEAAIFTPSGKATGTCPSGPIGINTISVGFLDRNSGNIIEQGWEGWLGDQFVFDKALTDEECFELRDNPACIWDKRRTPVPTSAGGGVTYNFSASGSIALSGAAPLTRGRVFLPSGVVVFSGTSPFTATGVANYTFSASGSFTLSGASPASRGRVFLPSGAVAFSGSSPFSSGASASYTFNTGGSFSLSGVSLMARGRVLLSSGSITFSGAALWQKGWVYPASGQVQFSGTANMYFTSGLASGLVDRMLKGMGK